MIDSNNITVDQLTDQEYANTIVSSGTGLNFKRMVMITSFKGSLPIASINYLVFKGNSMVIKTKDAIEAIKAYNKS